jgi:hypothetical protein
MALYLMLLNRSHYIRDAIVILNLAALMLINFSAMASDPDVPVVGRTTIARQAAEWNSDGKPVKLDFDSGISRRGRGATARGMPKELCSIGASGVQPTPYFSEWATVTPAARMYTGFGNQCPWAVHKSATTLPEYSPAVTWNSAMPHVLTKSPARNV